MMTQESLTKLIAVTDGVILCPLKYNCDQHDCALCITYNAIEVRSAAIARWKDNGYSIESLEPLMFDNLL